MGHYDNPDPGPASCRKLAHWVTDEDTAFAPQHALVHIEQHGLTKLNKYIENHLKPELPQFSMSHLSSRATPPHFREIDLRIPRELLNRIPTSTKQMNWSME
jgi:hypothetical protein